CAEVRDIVNRKSTHFSALGLKADRARLKCSRPQEFSRMLHLAYPAAVLLSAHSEMPISLLPGPAVYPCRDFGTGEGGAETYVHDPSCLAAATNEAPLSTSRCTLMRARRSMSQSLSLSSLACITSLRRRTWNASIDSVRIVST